MSIATVVLKAWIYHTSLCSYLITVFFIVPKQIMDATLRAAPPVVCAEGSSSDTCGSGIARGASSRLPRTVEKLPELLLRTEIPSGNVFTRRTSTSPWPAGASWSPACVRTMVRDGRIMA